MTEYDELNEWYTKADNLVCAFSEDKLENIMLAALVLRQTYIEGKIDATHACNNSLRRSNDHF